MRRTAVEVLGCETTPRQNKNEVEKTTYQKQKSTLLGIEPPTTNSLEMLMECKPSVNHSASWMTHVRLICYLYVGIYVRDRNTSFDLKRNQHPSLGGRWETTRAKSRPPPAESGETSIDTVRHVEQTPHRMVDFISGEGVYGSKPGPNLTYRLLRHAQHIYTYFYYGTLYISCTRTSSYRCCFFC